MATHSSKKARKKKQEKKFLNNPLVNKIVGLLFVFATFLIIILPPTIFKPESKTTDKNPISINSKLLESKDTDSNPVRIVIPKTDIDISVTDSEVVNGYWELSETTASYGLGSGQPGTKSNTVIFAHAREGLFYNLKDLKLKDTIYVFTKDKWHRYSVNKITTVYPNQIEVIQPTKNEVLTLYTCSGFSDEKRLIIQAIPQK